MKFIILDEDNWKQKDFANVLLCGRKDNDIKKFNPKFYIILNRTNDNHYELVTWKGKSMLIFSELPWIIRQLIVEKCLERNSGLFFLIPQFAKLKYPEEKEVETIISDESVPFSEKTVFQFYSGSSGKKAPGLGAGEKISAEDTKTQKYKTLTQIKDWRKILSNFAKTPFKLDGLNWNGVEWYYQGSKFKKNNSHFYREFSSDSGSEISKDPVLAKIAGGKRGVKYKTITVTDDETGKTTKQKKQHILRSKDITMDEDFFKTGRHRIEMIAALY